MKKLFALGLAAASVLGASAAVGTTAAQKGFKLESIYAVENISTTASGRSGVGINDKFYVTNVYDAVKVYDKDGNLIKTIEPTAGYHIWTSSNLDAAGHLLVQLDNSTSETFTGSCSPNGGHGFMVIDTETDEVVKDFLPMTFGWAQRFDAMAPVDQNILTDYNTRILSPLNAGASSYQFSYNAMDKATGDIPEIGYWKTAPFPTNANLDEFCQGATAQTTTGYALQFPGADGKPEAAILCNPYFSGSGQRGTFSAEDMFGNAIRRYTGNWTATADYIFTPMHAGITGYNIFTLADTQYIIYPLIGKDAEGKFTNPAGAFGIAELTYVQSPKTDMTMEGETLVDGLPAGVLKAIANPALSEAGAPLYTAATSCAPSYNIEPIEGDANSVYIYVFYSGAPAVKYKFSVNVADEPVLEAKETTIEATQLDVKAPKTINGYTITTKKGEGNNDPFQNTSEVRLYAKNTLTISGKNITSIKINLSSTNTQYTTVTASTGEVAEQAAGDTEVIWTGDAETVTFTVGEKATLSSSPTKAGQIRFTSIVITGIGDGEGGDEPEPVDPTLPEGTGEGTVASPYDVAKVLYMIAKGTNDENAEVYVKGEITSITEVSLQYGNATYTISDKGADNSLIIFRGKDLGNKDFTSEDAIMVGDEVVVYGKAINYGGNKPQLTTGNYLYSINGKTYEGGEEPEPIDPPTPTEDFSDCTGTEPATIAASELTVPGITKFTAEGESGYGFDIKKADGITVPAINAKTATLRLYADNTIAIYGGKLTTIKFTLNTSTGAARYTTLAASTGTVTEQTSGDTEIIWTGDATEVTFTVGHDATLGTEGASKPGQIHITEIAINEASEPDPNEPSVTAKLGNIITQDGYTLQALWTADNISVADNTNRSGVGVNDKFYVNYYGEGVRVYSNTGELLKTIPATEGYHCWVSCNADQAGHVLVQLDKKAFDGTCSANGDHGFMVIDSETDEVIVPFLPMKIGATGRFDAMAPVQGNILETEKVGIWCPITNQNYTYRVLYNQPGVQAPAFWQAPFKTMSDGVVATADVPSLFPAGAAKQTSTGYVMQYVFGNDENFSVAEYSNPVYNITYSAEGMFGNGIRKYQSNYQPTADWFYTPQHSGLSGFNFFKIGDKDYIIYPAGKLNEAGDAFAIAEVTYVDSPATDMNKLGETSVEGPLVARVYAALNEAGTLPIYKGNTSTLNSYNIEPVPGDEKSVYIYLYANGAPGVKYKFTVAGQTSAVEGIEAADEAAEVEYYNLQGIRVANPGHGFYIKRQGNKTTKVIL